MEAVVDDFESECKGEEQEKENRQAPSDAQAIVADKDPAEK
jgi:hypothetical protein